MNPERKRSLGSEDRNAGKRNSQREKKKPNHGQAVLDRLHEGSREGPRSGRDGRRETCGAVVERYPVVAVQLASADAPASDPGDTKTREREASCEDDACGGEYPGEFKDSNMLIHAHGEKCRASRETQSVRDDGAGAWIAEDAIEVAEGNV